MQLRITEQQGKVRSTGREVGDEAGMGCDWHDNFGFEDAQRRLETESTRLRDMIHAVTGCEIVKIREQNERVSLGATAKIIMVNKKTGGEETKEVTIGAFGESLPDEGLIIYNTPLAKVLIGKEAGDIIEDVEIAGTQYEICVDEIFPPSYKYNALHSKLFDKKS